MKHLISFLFLLLFFLLIQPVTAQLGYNWTPPQRILGYPDEAQPPYLVADENQTVHALNSFGVNQKSTVVYSQWTVERGWTIPNDIILAPLSGHIKVMGVALDKKGMMHLLMFSGEESKANIYYSRAPATEANQANAWSAPLMVGQEAATPSIAALALNEQGHLFVVYSGKRDGRGLYTSASLDGGETWSDPTLIFLTYDEELFPWAVRMTVDQQQQLHVVWIVNSTDGNGDVLYYARQAADNIQWTEPRILAVEEGYEVDWPSLIEKDGELFLIYQNAEPATRWMIRSFDYGDNWTAPVRLFPHVGEYGHVALLIDNNQTLQMILGNRNGNPAIHGMWHSTWQGKTWSDLEPIISGVTVNTGFKNDRFDPSAPQAIVSQGNILLVTWKTDPIVFDRTDEIKGNGVWFSYKTLNAPSLPISPIPTLVPSATQLATPTPLLVLTPTSVPLPDHLKWREVEPSRPGVALAAGIIPVIALISIFLLVNYFMLYKRYT